ncbi:46 kDa FK506-binding nuclear protein-like [Diachasmimorpha longicaudata]|uniref:46 kDa FK506-binding nuclear protein-like n=1 Tax=Diachasmimorpha longicaudata TaxID=58733 RepID=UPI0030B9079E
MFWGLIIEPNKRYTQTVEKPFHVSMATLDASTADDDIVQVMLCYDNRNYLLCNLKKGHVWQVPLDLNFQEGTKIAFTSNGRGHVHLTGYLVPDEGIDDLDDLDEEDEEEEEEDEDEVPQLVGKRKAKNSPKEGKSTKRLKGSIKEVAEDEEEDDSSDDEGLLDGLMADDDSEDDECSEDEDEAEAKHEEDDDDEESEEEEEEEVEEVKPQKKGKQNQSQQQEQSLKQQKKKKKEKAQQEQKQAGALVNGNDKKAEKKGKEVHNDSSVPKKKTVSGGVQIEELKLGEGAPAKPGRFVSVYYIGRLSNGKKFDATMQGEGFKFRLGKGEVIRGWDVGLQGMKAGGKRRLTIPPHMAYGVKGCPPSIPGNSELVFDVELKKVH